MPKTQNEVLPALPPVPKSFPPDQRAFLEALRVQVMTLRRNNDRLAATGGKA